MAWASRTSSYDHTLWNLGVGMGIAGDTKPTIATRVFAAYLAHEKGPGTPWRPQTELT